MCKFGGDPAICLREEAICAKVYRRTDDGRRAIVLVHSWNELKTVEVRIVQYSPYISPILLFLWDKSHPEILRDPPSGGIKQGWGNKLFF